MARLLNSVSIHSVLGEQAGAQTAVASTGLLTRDCEGVVYIFEFNAIASGGEAVVSVQDSPDGSTWTSRAETETYDDNDTRAVRVLDVPVNGVYQRLSIARQTANVAITGIRAIMYGSSWAPPMTGGVPKRYY